MMKETGESSIAPLDRLSAVEILSARHVVEITEAKKERAEIRADMTDLELRVRANELGVAVMADAVRRISGPLRAAMWSSVVLIFALLGLLGVVVYVLLGSGASIISGA